MQTYVEIEYPGSFFAESEVRKVSSRRPSRVAKQYPNAFAFRFFDQESKPVKVDGAITIAKGPRRNLSPRYFPGGEIMTAPDIEKLNGDHSILLSNMRCNGWPKVVRTRMGNFQPFGKDCKVIA